MGMTKDEIDRQFYPARIAQAEFCKAMEKVIADQDGKFDNQPNSFPEYIKMLFDLVPGGFKALVGVSREDDGNGNPVLKIHLEDNGYKFMIYDDARIAKYKLESQSEKEFITMADALTIFNDRMWIDAIVWQLHLIMKHYDEYKRTKRAERELFAFMKNIDTDRAATEAEAK